MKKMQAYNSNTKGYEGAYMPGEKKRSWIKLWVNESLRGTIRFQLTPEQRGVWYDILLFAAAVSDNGIIADRSGKPFPVKFLAAQLNISERLMTATLKSCVEEGRIVNRDGVLVIQNWAKYQSDYLRQKPYRKAKVL